MDKKAKGLLYILVFHYFITLVYLGLALANSRTGMLIACITMIVLIVAGISLNVLAFIDASFLARSWLMERILFAYGIWVLLASITMSGFPWLMLLIITSFVNFSSQTTLIFVFFASAFIVAVFTIYWVIKYRTLKRYMKKYRIPMEEAKGMLHNDLLEAWGLKTHKWEQKRQNKKQLKEQLPPSDAPLVNESKLKDDTLLKP